MHPILEEISAKLSQLADQITKTIKSNDPLSIVHNNWSFPGVTRDELAQVAKNIGVLIECRGSDVLIRNETLLADYGRRIDFLKSNTVPQIWGNSAVAVPTYLATLSCLKNALEEAFEDSEPQAVEVKRIEAVKTLHRIQKPIRAIEARIKDIDSRSSNLNEKVERIEQAHDAADQFPADLEYLKEKRNDIDKLLSASARDQGAINVSLTDINATNEELKKRMSEATAILGRCHEAYRAQTSEGLASAFAERSKALNSSMWIWVAGLILALIIGAVLGSNQLHQLAEAITKEAGQSTTNDYSVVVSLLLSLLSIGAPVWFAWLSTKQIGQRFRLAEDYGYKASISKAYEGYRREAALLDPLFQDRLFSSALSRLDEIPLRLVETDTHGSPWHELASSHLVRQAINGVPGFVDKVTELAKEALPGSPKLRKVARPEEVTQKPDDVKVA